MSVSVELRKNGMEAYAIVGPGVTDAMKAAESVYAQLVQAGVMNPPDKSVIARTLTASGLSGEVLVATGTPPQHGISAQLFPSFPIKNTPLEEGIDPLDAYWRNITYPGEIILRKTPASDGIPGQTLLGATVMGNPGSNAAVKAVGGIIEEGSGLSFKSNTYGVVTFYKGQLGVVEAVRMDEERMEARITVLPDQSRDEDSQLDKITSALRDINIVRGLDREAISNAIHMAKTMDRPVHDVLAAVGQPAVDAHDAEYKVLIDLERKALKVLDGDRVDFREKDTVKNINQGEPLAEVVPATKPVPGFRVDGSAIPPKTVHVETLKPGTGVVLSEDGKYLLAESGGMVLVKGGKFSVVAEYDVQGDVDIKTGNIRAAGLVKISGNVTAGFIVNAGRDLTVGGDIWEAEVECAADIKVFGAITAGSKVRAKGDIAVRFIQDSYVDCEGDVDVSLNITASEVYSKGKLKVSGSQGLIVGGVVNATMGIEARTIGSPTARTCVAVGLDLRMIKELDEIRKHLPTMQEDLKRLHASLGREFLKDPQKAILAIPPALRKNKLEVLKAMKDIQQRMTTMNARLEELNNEIKELKEAVITVHGEIHAGTEVTVGRVRGTISETLRRVTVHQDRENNCITYRKI